MTEYEERQRVIAMAIEWKGTPYVPEGRVKGKCADCTFFAKVFEDAGLIPPVDIPRYSPQAHLNRQASAYLPLVMRHAQREIAEEEVQPGDVVMYRIARGFSHGGLIINWPQIIHADMGARAVILDEGDRGRLAGHQRRFFSFW